MRVQSYTVLVNQVIFLKNLEDGVADWKFERYVGVCVHVRGVVENYGGGVPPMAYVSTVNS